MKEEPSVIYNPDEIAEKSKTKSKDPNRKVSVKIPLDRRKGRGVYVSVNNYRYFIPRGEVVEVPYFIAAVLENSIKQDEETERKIAGLVNDSRF